MPKVTLNKTVKVKGKGMLLAGVEVDVTEKEKTQLEKDGHIGEASKSSSPTNEKEIKALIAEVQTLKAENETLKAEIETLKAENETLASGDLLGGEKKKDK